MAISRKQSAVDPESTAMVPCPRMHRSPNTLAEDFRRCRHGQTTSAPVTSAPTTMFQQVVGFGQGKSHAFSKRGNMRGLPAARPPHSLSPKNLKSHRIDSVSLAAATAKLRPGTGRLSGTKRVVCGRLSIRLRFGMPPLRGKGRSRWIPPQLPNKVPSGGQEPATPRQRPHAIRVGGRPCHTEASSTESNY